MEGKKWVGSGLRYCPVEGVRRQCFEVLVAVAQSLLIIDNYLLRDHALTDTHLHGLRLPPPHS